MIGVRIESYFYCAHAIEHKKMIAIPIGTRESIYATHEDETYNYHSRCFGDIEISLSLRIESKFELEDQSFVYKKELRKTNVFETRTTEIIESILPRSTKVEPIETTIPVINETLEPKIITPIFEPSQIQMPTINMMIILISLIIFITTIIIAMMFSKQKRWA